jgi:TusE/DsrC/DsvC family sulfur relay protein
MLDILEEPRLEFDDAGLLKHPAQWDETVAEELARREGIPELTDKHWEIIHALRSHYVNFGVVPAMSHVCHDHDKGWQWVHELFHTCLGAWRVAGLPDPGEEAKTYLNDM